MKNNEKNISTEITQAATPVVPRVIVTIDFAERTTLFHKKAYVNSFEER